MSAPSGFQLLPRHGAPDLAVYWRPGSAPQAVLVFVHGYGEHMGRYEEIFAGFAAEHRLGFDLRGHGHSGGRRGHVSRFDDYHADLALALELAATRAPGLPVFVIAHSFGGLIAVDFVARRQPALAGLVLSSPGLAFRYVPPAWERAVAWLASRLWPTFTRSARLDVTRLSHDPEVEAKVRADPLTYSFASARWYTEARAAQRRVPGLAPALTLPLLCLVAGDDALVDPECTEAFFRAVPEGVKSLRRYPDAFHELFQERDCVVVFAEVRAWLDAALAAVP